MLYASVLPFSCLTTIHLKPLWVSMLLRGKDGRDLMLPFSGIEPGTVLVSESELPTELQDMAIQITLSRQ